MRRQILFFAAIVVSVLWWGKVRGIKIMRSGATLAAAPGQKPAAPPPGIGLWRQSGLGMAVGGQPVTDAWAVFQTRHESVVDAAPGERLRTRHVSVPGKYPLIRVEERWGTAADGSWRLIGQLAMVADHVVVKTRPGMTEKVLVAALRGLDVVLRRKLPASGQYLIAWQAVDDFEKLPQMLARLHGLGAVVSVAEPDWILRTSLMPNDSRLAEQWALNNTGQTGGTADADIDAPEAWELHAGGSAVKVGVIDTGIQYSHPDLAANIWTNPGEISDNGIDDDGNGYIDDVRGWDFANDDNDPADDHNHGTHVAGTIAAGTNNSAGVAGVCWQARLVPLKFIGSGGYGTNSDATEAIAYATAAGVHLTSNSWGGGGFSQAMLDAITAARDAGILFVAAAGNNGSDTDSYPFYPAGFDVENIISVAATDHNDALAYFSNRGSVSVDLAAPGVNVLSTVINGYAAYSGTSMAAPHVAGVCALLKSAQPGMSMADVKGAVLASADAVAALEGKTAVGGRLNAHAALRLQGGRLLVTPRTELAGLIEQGEAVSGITRTYTLKHLGAGTAEWTAVTSVPWITLSATGGSLASAASTTVTAGIAPAASQFAPGIYEGTVTFRLLSTGAELSCSVRLEVTPPPLHHFTLDADPGWALTGQWAHGTPGGAGGTVMGNADPSSAATGTNVLGVNLAGDHATTPGGPFYVTTTPLSFTGMQRVRLKFRRWLNTDVEPYVKAVVQVSTNGSQWTTVWQNGSGVVTDSTWTTQLIDLAAIADGQAAVQVRWGYEVAAGAQAASGWNIDDVSFYATPARTLSFDPPPAVAEGGAAVNVTLRASQAPAADLTVTLSSSSSAQLNLPATVMLPAGATQVVFSAIAVNDTLLDGTQAVTISASATGYSAGPSEMSVQDDETTTLSLSLPASGIEGGVPAAGLLTMGAVAGAEVRVPLTSSLPGRAQVPAFVVIAAGQSSAAFSVLFPDNALLDGDGSAVISAAVTGWTTGTASLTVQDNDGSALVLNVPATLAEGQGSAQGTVRINGTLPGDLVITLASSEPSEITVPASVTIPAGSLSAAFTLTIVNDTLQDGAQPVVLTASSGGFVSGQAALSVADDEVSSFTFDPIPLYQTVSVAFPVRISARDVNGTLAAGFSGIASLSATSGTPSLNQTTAFESGVWSGWLSFSQVVVDTRVVVTSGSVTAQSGLIYVRDKGYITMNVGSSIGGMVYEPVTKRLYVALPAANQIRVVNPEDLSFESFTVSGGPSLLAVSADGTQLYTTVSNNSAIIRVPLATRVPAQTIPLALEDGGATGLAVLPENPLLLAVGEATGVSVFDNGIRRPVRYATSYSVLATDGSRPERIYVSPMTSNARSFIALRVDGDGVRQVAHYPFSLRNGSSDRVSVAGNRAITHSGIIFDPETGIRLASPALYGASTLTCADSSAQRFYRLSIQQGSFFVTFNTGSQSMLDFEEGPANTISTSEPNGTSAGWLTSLGDRWLAFSSTNKIIFINSSTVPKAASVDLSVEQAISPSVVQTGQTAHVLMRVKNRGPGTATAGKVTCTLPAGLSFQSGTVAGGSVSAGGSVVTATLGDLPAGAIVNVFMRVTGATAGTATNTATVSSHANDFVSTNNSSTATCTVQSSVPDALRVNLGIHHAVYDPVTRRIYAAMSRDSNTRLKNCILPVDPETGELGAPIEIGMNPGVLALTDDSQYLYCVLRDGKAIGRYDVTAGRIGRSFEYSSDTSANSTPVPFLGTVPGMPEVTLVPQYALSAYDRGVYKNAFTQQVYSVVPSATTGQFYVADSGGLRTCLFTATGMQQLSVATNAGGYGLRRSGRLLIPSGGSAAYEIPAMNNRTDLIPPGFSGIVAVDTDPYDRRVYGYTYSQVRAFDGDTLVQTGSAPLPSPTYVDTNGTASSAFFRLGRKGFAACYAGSLSIVNNAPIVPEPPVEVVLPTQLVEGAGAFPGAGRVKMRYPLTSDLTVTLASSRPGLLRTDSQVLIPAGQTSVTFDYEAFNDVLVNGARVVTITPSFSNPALTPRSASVTITDDENAMPTLSLPATLTEGAGVLTAAGTLSLSVAADEPLTFTLTSSNSSELAVPATVTMPAGASSTTFALTLPNDDWLDGGKNVTITASLLGWQPAQITGTVEDNDPRTLTLTFPNGTSAVEGVHLSCRVGLTARAMSLMALTVTFSPSGGTTTAYVLSGDAYADISLGGSQDYIAEADETRTVSVSYPGFTGASGQFFHQDDDPATMVWGSISSPKQAGQYFPFSLTGYNLSGQSAPVMANVTVTQEAEGIVYPQDYVIFGMSGGNLQNGSFAPKKSGASRLRAQVSGSGLVSFSDVFQVQAGPAVKFIFGPVPSAAQAGGAFPASVRAVDDFDNLASFSGSARLAVLRGVSESSYYSSGGSAAGVPATPGAKVQRSQFIYSGFVINGYGPICRLSFKVLTPSAQPLENFTLRLKSPALGYFTGSYTGWDNTGLTTHYQGAPTFNQGGWVPLDLQTPYNLAYGGNLMIDSSFSNAQPVAVSFNGSYSSSSCYLGTATSGDPLAWSGTSPVAPYSNYYLPDIKIGFGTPVTASPASTGAFTSNAWTGPLTIQSAGTGTVLRATSGSITGDSAAFTVHDPLADADTDKLPDWWESANALTVPFAGANDDPDFDGRSNLLEYLTGTAPKGAGAATPGLETITSMQIDGNQRRTCLYTYRRRASLTGWTFGFQVSDTLGAWTSAGLDLVEQTVVPEASDPSFEIVTVLITLPTGWESRAFLRLNITSP